MLTVLLVVLVLLFIGIIIGSLSMGYQHNGFPEEEIVTTTTVTEYSNEFSVVGDLIRQHEDNHLQHFVIDPVDGEKFFLNDKDDMYEDANGKIWRLI